MWHDLFSINGILNSAFSLVSSLCIVLQAGASFEAVNVVTVAIVPVCVLLIVIAENVQTISRQVRT